MDRNVVKVSTFILMEIIILVIGFMIKKKDKEKWTIFSQVYLRIQKNIIKISS